jgi:ATP-dependent Lon protease
MFDEYILEDMMDDQDNIPFMGVADDDEEQDTGGEPPRNLPVIALTNTVLYPGTVIPITIGRKKSIAAVNAAFKGDKWIAAFTQKSKDIDNPREHDLYRVGTMARIIRLLKMPDKSITAIIQGRRRCSLENMVTTEPYLKANCHLLTEVMPDNDLTFRATVNALREKSKRIIELSSQIPNEAIMMIENVNNDLFLLNFIATNLNINVGKKQDLLETGSISDRAEKVLKYMDEELQMLEIKGQIEEKVRGEIEQQQKDYFLNQQLKTLQKELGQNPQEQEFEKLEKRVKEKKWPEYAAKKFNDELSKVKRMNPQVAEYSIALNYLEFYLDLPWDSITKDNFDLKKVKKILDEDHFGLEDVKERIIEHLAVLKLKGDMKAPIICLVGPPGVGKTSLGKSIARALNRNFVRMSLGGLHDESEIRGHRKTYIGALPGRILSSIKKAKSSNPVFILDEIDKVGATFRGDPSSALLEVLDPEQNNAFYDNYLETEYDLSKVLFIATANSLASIQPALLDRMEVIELSGYSTEEKIEIAKKHLVPQQLEEHGLKKTDAAILKGGIREIIERYTRESGVRSLNRQIGKVMRHVAKKVATEESYEKKIKADDIEGILGPQKFSKDRDNRIQVPGVAIGLAWTRVGGDILFIEASLSKGKGRLTLTGNLGDVMKESATSALSFIRANAKKIGIDENAFERNDIHIHVPEGAIPKDGPSAGITMLSALTSAFLGRKLRSGLAMTGEITLRGKVLPVGGIKEKILAAKRSGLNTVILCAENEKHVKQIDENYIKGMHFVYVDDMMQVLEHALVK